MASRIGRMRNAFDKDVTEYDIDSDKLISSIEWKHKKSGRLGYASLADLLMDYDGSPRFFDKFIHHLKENEWSPAYRSSDFRDIFRSVFLKLPDLQSQVSFALKTRNMLPDVIKMIKIPNIDSLNVVSTLIEEDALFCGLLVDFANTHEVSDVIPTLQERFKTKHVFAELNTLSRGARGILTKMLPYMNYPELHMLVGDNVCRVYKSHEKFFMVNAASFKKDILRYLIKTHTPFHIDAHYTNARIQMLYEVYCEIYDDNDALMFIKKHSNFYRFVIDKMSNTTTLKKIAGVIDVDKFGFMLHRHNVSIMKNLAKKYHTVFHTLHGMLTL